MTSPGAVWRVLVALSAIVILCPSSLVARGPGGQEAMAGGAAANAKPAILDGITIEQKLNAQIPLGLRFVDETGKTVTLGEYFTDRPVILNLLYYRCGMLCPEVLHGLTQSLKEVRFDVGKEYDVLTVSFDPRDTPALSAEKKQMVLSDLGQPNAAHGWRFLTGQEPAIRALTDAVGFGYRWDPKTQQFVHAAGIVILTPQGRVSKYFYGLDFKPVDVRFGLMQASANHIGTLVDTILLFCCTYDATTGKYNWLVGRLLSIGGALTILVLGSFLYILSRGEPRRPDTHNGPATPANGP